MSEDLEQLSRYRAGELASEVARALESQPGFAEKIRKLELLDAAARSLSVELAPEKVVALLAKVRRPAPKQQSRLNFRVGLGVLAAGVTLVVLKTVTQQGAPWTLVSAGEVTVNGQLATATQSLPRGSTVRTGPKGAAQLVGAGGWIGLAGGGEITDPRGRGHLLTQGNAAVSSEAMFLAAGDVAVEIHGVAVLSMEPSEGVARVTDTLNQFPSGDLMKTQWMKLSTVAMTAAAVGGALTLFVVDGHASVRQSEGPPLELKAGERWKAGDAKPTSYRAPALAVAEVAKAPQPVAALTGESTRPTSPELAKLSQPELIALVGRLSDEKESLLKQREALKKKFDGDERPRRNFYRFSPEELTELAKKGEVDIRGPQLGGQETKIDDKVRDELRMTPEEVAAATAIFETSTARAHQQLLAFYKEIGGDPALGSTLGSDALYNEIREKSLKDDWTDAVRQTANERAGLSSPGVSGTPVLKALRMLVGEDERVIAELEQLLGPARAEQFLNNENTAHHHHYHGVGPAKPR